MAKLHTFLKQHSLWVGFLAVLIPLLIILGLQYRSLAKLEHTSAVARTVTLEQYLRAVKNEVQDFYRARAEHALRLPASTFMQDGLQTAATHFVKNSWAGAKWFFVVVFPQHQASQVLFYNPASQTLEPRPTSPETRAVKLASAPWKLLAREGAVIETGTFDVNEKDPEHRIILKPITNAAAQIVGLAGMIVDPVFFAQFYLPRVITQELERFFPGEAQADVAVTIRDKNGRLLLATQPVQEQEDEIVRRFWFIFTDWRLGMQSRHMTPEQWARWNFALNASLSTVMTLVLIAGVGLALRTAAQAMKLSQMKTDFVSNVSHELRTPLASIRVFGEFLRLGWAKEPEKIREYGEYIETESQRLTQLISNILDFSQIESGRKTYQFETADVGEVVADTLKLFEMRLKQSGLTGVFETPDDPLPAVMIDPDAIAQALTNLLDNAVKYSGSAKEIRVRLGQQKGWVTIAVTDRGIGIPHKEHEKIFEKFYRVSTGLVHDVKGSGLGLAIVEHIVHAHHGKVTIESKAGQGSTFTIHLPATERHGAHPEGQEQRPAVKSSPSLEFEVKA